MSKETKVLGSDGTTLVCNGACPLHSGEFIEVGKQIVLRIIFRYFNFRAKSKQMVNVI